MSDRILRFPLKITDYQSVFIPGPSRVLSAAVSRTDPNGEIDMWALATNGAVVNQVGLYIVGTGNPIPPQLSHYGDSQFIGTVVTPSGLVWHVLTGLVQ